VSDQKFLKLALSPSAFDVARPSEYDARVLEVMYVGDMTEEEVGNWLEGTGVTAVKLSDKLFHLTATLDDFCPVLCQTKEAVFSRLWCPVRQTGTAIFASLQRDLAESAVFNSWPIQVTAGRDDREDSADLDGDFVDEFLED
jgi:hypothetical protein